MWPFGEEEKKDMNDNDIEEQKNKLFVDRPEMAIEKVRLHLYGHEGAAAHAMSPFTLRLAY